MGEAAAVEMHDVRFSYGTTRVLESADLAIERGEFVGVVGPNGGGKTTLLKLILGLLTPDAGAVRVLGQPPRMASHALGYVPQHFSPDPRFPMTVLDVVLLGRLGCGRGFGPFTSDDRQRVSAALDRVGLEGKGGLPYAELSGGQRQRALIARALVSEPEILVLDEPTAGLDPAIEREVLRLLRELNDSMTLILVTHDLTFVADGLETVLCVSSGQVVRHPTVALHDVTSDLLSELLGADVRAVRHDHLWPEAEGD
ncbi:MAG: ATP-binding cassette domain-containing protein [Armatimonadia bacterium]|nr:ATP-binding cassette domain-containing protein [Armatimonadia bacterium]